MNFKNINVKRGILRQIWQLSIDKCFLGGDPEFFVGNKKGKILASDKFLPSKYKPKKVRGKSDLEDKDWKSNRIYFDGIQGEMALAPVTCRDNMTINIYNCLRAINRAIGSDNKIILKPSSFVDRQVIDDADPDARIFGCEPDFNAYTLKQNTPEMDASRHPYRYSGGHIHLGVILNYLNKLTQYEEELAKTPAGHIRLVKFIDVLVAIPSLLLDNGAGSARRRSKYGKAGCFRPTPYGIEYRTLSCWWLKSPMTVSLVYGLARMAWNICLNKLEKDFYKAIGCDEQDIRGIIDSGDIKEATKLWENKLGPHIALSFEPESNPLHIGTVMSPRYGYLDPKWVPKKGNKPRLSGEVNLPKKGQPVFALAAFEYIRKNGLSSIVHNDVVKEWNIKENRPMDNDNGMSETAYRKLRLNPDFHKFQESFLGAL